MPNPRLAMFAAYNRWCNERVYEAAGKLTDAEYRADRGAFFGSLHGTLNHLLATDRIWLYRFSGKGPNYDRLDTIVHDDFAALAQARALEDARIIDYVDGLDDAALANSFTYHRVSDDTMVTEPLGPSLTHLFNHQTHHRGQAHVLLTIARGRDFAPPLDLIAFQRLTGMRG